MTSIIKVNNLQNQCGANTINKCGTTLTIGASGDTVTLAAGASQSGFGQTYSAVSWDTTPKTGTFTAVSGVGYFVDTSSGVSTANLPAGSAGAIVSFADYTRTFQTNNLTITPNGSEKIGGAVANFVAQTEGQSITLIYVDATEGWINTAESTGQAGLGPAFVTATGGTITCSPCGDYKIHTFTGPGTFTVCSVGNPVGSDSVEYIVVAGAGGSGGGGGGAGGFRFASPSLAPVTYPAKPLAGTNVSVTAQGYSIAVGGGGPGSTNNATGDMGCRGSNSTFSTITSTGGGGAASWNYQGCAANMPGGSGGGGAARNPSSPGGSGNTPSVSPPQGNDGGDTLAGCASNGGSGGGGAMAAGINSPPAATGAPGGVGAGIPNAFGTSGESNGGFYYFAGGGGGSGRSPGSCAGAGGLGGGKVGIVPGTTPGPAGTDNTGGGAGGGGYSAAGDDYAPGGQGGSGIVIIRYKFQ